MHNHWAADHRPPQFEDTTARPDDLYRKRFLKEAVDQCVDQLPTHWSTASFRNRLRYRSSGRAVVSSNWSGRWSASQCFLIVWNSTRGLRLRFRSSFFARFDAMV